MRHKRNREYFHISNLHRRYDRQQGKFIFNIAYETTTKITPRTLSVAQAFGLGIDEQRKFAIYDNVELRIGQGDVVYITGDSGSGKSVLLKAIKTDLGEDCADVADVKPDADKPIVDMIGKNLNEALELLSKAGLDDAFLFVRRFSELSDGQRFRFRVAKLMESRKPWWVADEFCSVLDRDSARVVAFNLQKTARRLGVAVVVATTHGDLFDDLHPSVHVHKRFGKEIVIKYYPNVAAEECSLVGEMRVEEGTLADYKQLSGFHYRSACCPSPRRIFVLRRLDEVCGVIVYSNASPFVFGRSNVWKGDREKRLKELSTISRVVVHPKYRGIGLGKKLVAETLPLAGTQCVEAVAVMARYNPFFEHAGMQRIAENKPNPRLLETVETLRGLGFEPTLLGSLNHNLEGIKRVGKEAIIGVLVELSRRESGLRKGIIGCSKVFPRHDEFTTRMKSLDDTGLAEVLKRVGFMAQKKVYLFWKKHKKAQPFGCAGRTLRSNLLHSSVYVRTGGALLSEAFKPPYI